MIQLGFVLVLAAINHVVKDEIASSYGFNVVFHSMLVLGSIYGVPGSVLVYTIREYLIFDLIKMFFTKSLSNWSIVLHHVAFSLFCIYMEQNTHLLKHAQLLCFFEISSIWLNLRNFLNHYYFKRYLFIDILFVITFVYFRIFYGVPKLYTIFQACSEKNGPLTQEYTILLSTFAIFIFLHVMWTYQIFKMISYKLK